MPLTPEQQARVEIDRLLTAAGWHVCGVSDANIHAARGVAIREFPLAEGHGFADYLFYVDGKAAGVIEAKKAGVPLVGVERQSAKYTTGMPGHLPAWIRPLPFAYESTGVETRFTNGLDPEPRSRGVFAFHRPEMLADWLRGLSQPGTVSVSGGIHDAARPETFLSRVRSMPPLVTEWGEHKLWPAQITAIRNLEKPRRRQARAR